MIRRRGRSDRQISVSLRLARSLRRRDADARAILFGWLVADVWCWFVLKEEYCWLVAGGWFVLREKYCWLVADKPSEQWSLAGGRST
jgi:hypothetical protein